MVPLECTGEPRFFVSNTWSVKLSALLSQLKDHFGVASSTDAGADVLLWLVRGVE